MHTHMYLYTHVFVQKWRLQKYKRYTYICTNINEYTLCILMYKHQKLQNYTVHNIYYTINYIIVCWQIKARRVSMPGVGMCDTRRQSSNSSLASQPLAEQQVSDGDGDRGPTLKETRQKPPRQSPHLALEYVATPAAWAPPGGRGLNPGQEHSGKVGGTVLGWISVRTGQRSIAHSPRTNGTSGKRRRFPPPLGSPCSISLPFSAGFSETNAALNGLQSQRPCAASIQAI